MGREADPPVRGPAPLLGDGVVGGAAGDQVDGDLAAELVQFGDDGLGSVAAADPGCRAGFVVMAGPGPVVLRVSSR